LSPLNPHGKPKKTKTQKRPRSPGIARFAILNAANAADKEKKEHDLLLKANTEAHTRRVFTKKPAPRLTSFAEEEKEEDDIPEHLKSKLSRLTMASSKKNKSKKSF
jgi:hypothetical protein